MRSIFMASAALLLTAGVACAQTATTSPAPEGAVSGTNETNPGQSPGKTAPAPGAPMAATTTPGASSAPAGATNAPVENAPNQPAGKTAPESAMNSPMHHHHHWAKDGMMPENAGPGAYLHMAKAAMAHHDYARADDALSHAETLELTRAVPQSDSISADQSPAVSAIEQARKALHDHDTQAAMQATDAAMQAMPHHDHMKPGMGMGNNMSAPTPQATAPAPVTP